jgi:hypothetical protein
MKNVVEGKPCDSLSFGIINGFSPSVNAKPKSRVGLFLPKKETARQSAKPQPFSKTSDN